MRDSLLPTNPMVFKMAGHPQQMPHSVGPPGPMFRPKPGHGGPGMGMRMMQVGPHSAQGPRSQDLLLGRC